MSASVVCVDLSSESDEESNNGAKRRRLEDPLRQLAPSVSRPSLPVKLVNIPKASLGPATGAPGAGVGATPARAFPIPADPLRSMHIPSGITVTKHQKSILTTNGNLTISLAETNNNKNNSNNNNTISYNNNVKQVKLGAGQKVAWSVSSKAPSPNAVITTVPSHQVKVTPANQIRVTAGAKVIQSPIRVTPKIVPVKIQSPVVIGQPQQQLKVQPQQLTPQAQQLTPQPQLQQQKAQPQQIKPIIVGITKPKASMGQMLHQQQQQQKSTLPGQVPQRIVAGQQQQRASLGQLQQQQPPRFLINPLQQKPKPLHPPQKSLARPPQLSVPQKTAAVGQPQQQPKAAGGQQQQPKAIVGQQQQPQAAGGQQQQPKAIVGQQQQPKAIVGQQQQPKAIVGQQQQPKAIMGQQPQPTVIVGQQQQPKDAVGQQLQPKAIMGQQPQPTVIVGQQQQPKAVMGQQQQPNAIVGQQQQPKAIVGQQPEPKAIVGQPQQTKAIVGQQLRTSSSQPLPQKIPTVQLPQQKTSLGPVQPKQKPLKSPVEQQQQQLSSLLQLQQHRISIGQLQLQGAMMGQLQQLQMPQKSVLGLIQQQPKVYLGQPQLPRVPMGLLRPLPQSLQQNLTVTPIPQSPKTQMAQQLMNSVISQKVPAQQPSLPVFNEITHKSMTIQKLPVSQKAPTVVKVPPKILTQQTPPPAVTKFPPKQMFPQQTPPPAHLLQKRPAPQAPMQTPPCAHRPPMVRPATVTKITPVPPNGRAGFQMKVQPAGVVNAATAIMSAARTLPFRSSSHKSATPPPASTHLQGFTTSATPPQRLLATPPHCAAALNEPLLLNLPPTTSITPQLTPTTTPPPAGLPAAVQQHQLAKAAAFKLNSLPGASISPVIRTPASTVKRIQPITVLKKSDEEWRRHILEQQQQQQEQQKQRNQLQSTSTPTIVLVESPPTTPPTDKPETDRSTNTAEKTPPMKSITINRPNSLKRPAPVTPFLRRSVNVIAEIVDLDELPDYSPEKRRKEEPFPIPKPQAAMPPVVTPFTPEYAALIRLCREVDPSEDMERLVTGKLTRYYQSAPVSFLVSRGFRQLLDVTIARIRSEPDVVYVHLKNLVDELKAQKMAQVVSEGKAVPFAIEHPHPTPFNPVGTVDLEEDSDSPTTDQRTNERIRQLNRTLHSITKRIRMLEDAEVDLNDDDSSYLQVERFKKRALQIYEKICDLTGESKSARRQLKPIQFKATAYPHFNRTLSAFVNRMREFPDYHDVLQILEHCNKEKKLGLANFEMKSIAYDAFAKVGKLLQSRRKTDLYETVTHFTANVKDPASSDPVLLAKLKENNKKQTKISDVLEKYAREQDLNAEERQEARLKEKRLKQEKAEAEAAKLVALAAEDDQPCTSAQAAAKAAAISALMKISSGRGNGNEKRNSFELKLLKLVDEEEDSEEDDADSEDGDNDVDEFVDNFKANGEVSDADSDAEEETSPKKDPLAPAEEEDDVIEITRAETGNKVDVAPPNGKLKIMSVSSLNANFVHVQESLTKSNLLPSARPVIADQIVISDEES
ncbi:daxx-like protein isoform X2 [Drosophila biarmipes]|uniref:daxx-like protein isoform X2 n=1 Tax=Drosophila biarmipes TaxID=125945 RepID=UPI0021CC6962|nr:daxx-like protein isoform X2 [Drosophila biarmipes]